MGVAEFHYRVPWQIRSSRPGHHRGAGAGGGFEFRGHATLLGAPDPRRFDIQASLRDPFEQLVMRVYTQRSAIPVYLIADLSASMGFAGCSRKLDVLADFAVSLGYSAYRTGDPFGFMGCDSRVRADFLQPLTRAKAAGEEVSTRLRDFVPTASDARGMLEAPGHMSQSRSLVFLCSDFHFSLDLLSQILAGLARHKVVPVVLWDSVEIGLPASGIAVLRDAELGRQRTVLLRPALRERIHRAFAERRQRLVDCFLASGTTPLFLRDRFDAGEVTRYFCE
jgi:uncharacterized protein (DUF58 family)